jgi:hypothetical protein
MSKNHHTITEATEYGGQPAFPDFATGDMASVYRGDQSFSRLKAAFPSGEPPYASGAGIRQPTFFHFFDRFRPTADRPGRAPFAPSRQTGGSDK